MKSTPNIGETGAKSIRLGGMKMEDLPLAEAASAKPQLPDVEENEKQDEIMNIRASFPKQSVAYINSRIKECEENVVRIGQIKGEQQALINEYTSYISLCRHRDKELSKTTDEAERKEIKKAFPLYNVEAMQAQIEQSIDSINKTDEVIAREYQSIAELRELIGTCQQRDNRLTKLGVKIG